MAASTLTPQQVSDSGLQATYTAADVNGHTFVSGANKVLHVKNGGGAPITVTITTPGAVGGLAIADRTVSVTNATDKFIGPFGSVYGDPVAVAFSSVTSVTVALLAV
jgi:hypothetical protein